MHKLKFMYTEMSTAVLSPSLLGFYPTKPFQTSQTVWQQAIAHE